MATKKKAPSADAAPAAEAKTARKFPAGARKRKADTDPASGVAPAPVEPVVVPAIAPVAAGVVPPIAADAPAQEAIRARAWAIWRMYGGSPMQNWLRAEAELRDEAAKG